MVGTVVFIARWLGAWCEKSRQANRADGSGPWFTV
jgi:hypothetical protein